MFFYKHYVMRFKGKSDIISIFFTHNLAMLIHIGLLFELVLSLILKIYTYILYLKSFELDGPYSM